MKILTLNTHSLSERYADKKRQLSAQYIQKWDPDVIALQEVNQTRSAEVIVPNSLYAGQSLVKADNYAQALTNDLSDWKAYYQWTWLPVKLGYDIYEEGLAILTKHTMTQQEKIVLSPMDDFSNWRTRKALGVCIDDSYWFYCVHMGWWQDGSASFLDQWVRLKKAVSQKTDPVILAGDWNAPAEIRHQSYDTLIQDGWFDTYTRAKNVIGSSTVVHPIDGWNQMPLRGARMDHIFCNKQIDVQVSEVVFDGRNSPIVSDHFGVLMEGVL